MRTLNEHGIRRGLNNRNSLLLLRSVLCQKVNTRKCLILYLYFISTYLVLSLKLVFWLLLNPTSQRDEAIRGFESIPFIVHRYQVIERLRRPNTSRIVRKQADTRAPVTDLEKNMVHLYSKIPEHQIRLMRQCSHSWALRFGRDVLKWDEWKTVLSQIKELDSTCSRIAEELGQEELDAGMKENNVKIDTLLQSWNVGLQKLQEQGMNTYMAVDAHVREDHSWREREDTRDLLQALRAKNPYCDQMERTPPRQPGTCNWFLNHPRFQTWRNDPNASLL